MFKKIELWVLLLVILIFTVLTILFGALIVNFYVYKYEWSINSQGKFPRLQKTAIFFAKLPYNLKSIISNQGIDVKPFKKNKNLNEFQLFKKTDYFKNKLIILPRYDGDLKRSIVEVRDLGTFELLHTYKHDINKMNNLIDTSNVEFKNVLSDSNERRFIYFNPLVQNDGSLLAIGSNSFFKIDICSNLIWLNQDEIFHHSVNQSMDENFWVGAQMYPYSNITNTYYGKYGFGYKEDAIAKIDLDGKLIFIKSIAEILIENKIIGENLYLKNHFDPIHLNDIEEAYIHSKYWEVGDLFLSIRNQSAIIHYRPSENKVINYIKGPFFQQHDVDIISNKEISIFNNNNNALESKNFSEILIFNFETKKFEKKFNDKLVENNFKTSTEGLSEILSDGSLLVEEQNHGRLILFDKNGSKVWEFVNKDTKNDVFFISWSRIIENQNKVDKIKESITTNRCQK